MRYNKDCLPQIIDCLNRGGVFFFPTETVYSLSCDATNKKAVEKLYKIKRRPVDKPFSVLVPNIEVAGHYVVLTEETIGFIKKYSPGPISYVLPLKEESPIVRQVMKSNTLSIRIPDHPIAQGILNAYGKPIVGTSVNFSSQKSAVTIQEIPEAIKQDIDIIIEDDSSISGISSTVVDLCSRNIKILRQGELEVQ